MVSVVFTIYSVLVMYNEIERQEFNKQPFEKRAYLVNRHAEQLMSTKIGTSIIYLMHINNQLVELWYDTEKKEVADIYMPLLPEIQMFLDDIALPGVRRQNGFYIDTRKH